MAPTTENIFTLLIVYQFKHFLADFPLQREYMLKKFSPNWDFFFPLCLHCGVHAVLTLAIVIVFGIPHLWWIALVDFGIHFVMDRIKSGPRYLGRFNDQEKPGYWNALGFDQMVHHLTHMYLVWIIIHN